MLLLAPLLFAMSSPSFLKTKPVRWVVFIRYPMKVGTTALGIWVSCAQTPSCGGSSRIPAHCCLPTKPPKVMPSCLLHAKLSSMSGAWPRTGGENLLPLLFPNKYIS